MAEINDRWLSVNEIFKYIGGSKDTVCKWIDKHGMPTHRMGHDCGNLKKNRWTHGLRLAERLPTLPMENKINNTERRKTEYE
jgi:excisionase family DNA binding protein